MDRYYVVGRAGSNRYPLLAWDEDGLRYMRFEPVDDGRPIRLRLGSPAPAVPVMTDYHSLPSPVVSQRVRDVLAALPLVGVQLVPADVRVRGEDVRRYFLVHVYQRVAAIDRERSVLDLFEDGDVLGIQNLVLDMEKIAEVPLEQRLVFRLMESPSVHLFHESVVDAVLALQPEGVRFTPANGWSDSAGFRAAATP
ncbi:imm11 family protein [Pyxidicoccus sp. 3LG]